MRSSKKLILLVLIVCGKYTKADMKLMRPQVYSPPFFEGWYTKIDTKNRSLIIIVGTKFKFFKHTNKTLGMVSLISREGNNPARQFNIFPENISIGGNKDDYLWKTNDDSIVFSESYIKIDHLKLPSVEAKMNQHKSWKQGSPFGPEGLMAHSPLLFSHWYVFSMESNTVLFLKQGDKEIRELGYAHLEKNWGNGFPDKWMWSQGRTADNSTSFAFAGGRAPSHIGIPLDVWALSIKHEDQEYIYSPVVSNINAKLRTDCKSNFHFESRNLSTRVSLRLKSEPKNFLPIYGVKSQDWEQVAKESFHSFAYIDIHKGRRLITTKMIPFAAMEFGGKCIPTKD